MFPDIRLRTGSGVVGLVAAIPLSTTICPDCARVNSGRQNSSSAITPALSSPISNPALTMPATFFTSSLRMMFLRWLMIVS